MGFFDGIVEGLFKDTFLGSFMLLAVIGVRLLVVFTRSLLPCLLVCCPLLVLLMAKFIERQISGLAYYLLLGFMGRVPVCCLRACCLV
jgi:hypothetical protein